MNRAEAQTDITDGQTYSTDNQPTRLFTEAGSKHLNIMSFTQEHRNTQTDLGRNKFLNKTYNEVNTAAISLLWHAPPVLCRDRHTSTVGNVTIALSEQIALLLHPHVDIPFKFGTHVRIDTLTLKQVDPPHPGGLGDYLLLKIFRDGPRPNLACMCG